MISNESIIKKKEATSKRHVTRSNFTAMNSNMNYNCSTYKRDEPSFESSPISSDKNESILKKRIADQPTLKSEVVLPRKRKVEPVPSNEAILSKKRKAEPKSLGRKEIVLKKRMVEPKLDCKQIAIEKRRVESRSLISKHQGTVLSFQSFS